MDLKISARFIHFNSSLAKNALKIHRPTVYIRRWFGFVAMFTSNQLLELIGQIMGAFQERFNKAPPRKATLLDWERRAFGFGSVKDRLQSGRKKTREETCAGVAASIEQFPNKSTRCTEDNNARSHEKRSEGQTLNCVYSMMGNIQTYLTLDM
ncbi:hypothetical protein C0J52_17971 [Blattella germanica]|nr:hypothetical protein C0J52_17971 [Blattella germanica]